MENLEIGALIISLALFGLYHIYFLSSICLTRSQTHQLSFNLQNSLIWIDKHKVKDDAPSVTLAIQTLRNTILVAIFVGGSSFQYAFLSLNSLTDASDAKTKTRVIILATLLFLSFLCWTNVIRYSNHLGFVIGTMEYKAKKEAEERRIRASIDLEASSDVMGSLDGGQDSIEIRDLLEESKFMAHLMLFSFSLGFRFMYMSIPYMFYASGTIALLVSTAVMLLFLFSMDHPHVFIPISFILKSTPTNVQGQRMNVSGGGAHPSCIDAKARD